MGSFVERVQKLLEPYELGLRCVICYDFLDTAMMFPCSHNYCSICIRRSLAFSERKKCPTCSVAYYPSDLSNNRALDFLRQKYGVFRDGLFKLLVEAQEELDRHRHEVEVKKKALVFIPADFTVPKKSVKGVAERVPQPSPLGTAAGPVLTKFFSRKRQAGEGGGQSGHSLPSASVKVECPVCNLLVVDGLINKHLDACLNQARASQPAAAPASKQSSPIVYTYMSVNQARQLAKQRGLPSNGDLKDLISRHKEYDIVLAAEADSLAPRPNSQLVQEISRAEKLKRHKDHASQPMRNMFQLQHKRHKKGVSKSTASSASTASVSAPSSSVCSNSAFSRSTPSPSPSCSTSSSSSSSSSSLSSSSSMPSAASSNTNSTNSDATSPSTTIKGVVPIEVLEAEGNYYFDTQKCGIGFHGDSERKKVVAASLSDPGVVREIHWQWYHNSHHIGTRTVVELRHGDMYVMSEKASGFDWKTKKVPTLRHAAAVKGSKYLQTSKEKGASKHNGSS